MVNQTGKSDKVAKDRRYVIKHHLIGMFGGALIGYLFGTESSLGTGVFIGFIVGEIIGIAYSQLMTE